MNNLQVPCQRNALIAVVLLCVVNMVSAERVAGGETTWCIDEISALDEDFESGEFSSWTTWAGSWSIGAGYNSAYSVKSDPGNLHVLEYSMDTSVFIVEYDLRIANTDIRADGDIWISVIDENNYYLIALHKPGESVDSITLFQDGVENTLYQRTPVMGSGWHHVKVERDSEGWIRVYLDGTLHMDAQDSTITAPGAFALRAWFSEVYYDNISVTDCLGAVGFELRSWGEVKAQYR
jgi:hypothetical protein